MQPGGGTARPGKKRGRIVSERAWMAGKYSPSSVRGKAPIFDPF
jgi:hypothetical protein